MRKLIYFLFLVNSILLSNAQSPPLREDFNLTVSDEFRIPELEDRAEAIFDEEGKAEFILHQPGKKITFTWFDHQLKRNRETELHVDELPRGYKAEGFCYLSGMLYLIYSVMKQPKITELYCRPVDHHLGIFIGPSKKLLEGARMFAGGSLSPLPKFRYILNAEKTQVLIVYGTEPEGTDNSVNRVKVHLQVYDDKMENLWSKEVVIPHAEDMSKIKQYYLDSKGEAMIVVRVFDEREKVEKGQIRKKHFEIFQTGESGQVEQIRVLPENKYLNTLKVNEDLNGRITYTGYYANTERSAVCDGLFNIIADKKRPELTAEDYKYYPFTDTIKKIFEYGADQRKRNSATKINQNEESNMILRKVFFDDDGSMIVTGDEDFIYTQTNYSHYRGYSCTVISKISSSGALEWMTFVRKSIFGETGAYSLDGVFFIMYTESDKNLSLPTGKLPALPVENVNTKYALAYRKFDDEGNMQIGKICNLNDQYASTNEFLTIGDKYLMMMSGYSVYNFIRLNLK